MTSIDVTHLMGKKLRQLETWRCAMTKVSEIAITECVLELRAACRRPIDPLALDTLLGWVRPDFERILDRTDGKTRWAQLGPRVRETGRHLGAFADFCASHGGSA